jgi:hypothetical protein
MSIRNWAGGILALGCLFAAASLPNAQTPSAQQVYVVIYSLGTA